MSWVVVIFGALPSSSGHILRPLSFLLLSTSIGIVYEYLNNRACTCSVSIRACETQRVHAFPMSCGLSRLVVIIGFSPLSCALVQLPEILFGNNALELCHKPSGFLLQFEARGALKQWVKLFESGKFEVRVDS